jgi:predicted ATPase
MKYCDLVQFEPIESVIQLTDANDKDRAVHLIDTYVISERMAEQLDEAVIEHLQFRRPVDNKGLFIVGNYGTGKSHLMSVISTIAEMDGASNYIKNERVAQKAKEIEGQFKVIRTEIGSVRTSLRDILCEALEEGLYDMGVDFKFPSIDQVRNNKDALTEMMGLFQEAFPDQGLMLVVDELLDYLRSRKEQELTLDLGFLREVGEVCSKTRLRFIAGIQEMLFDNPKFGFVADSLRRVKERFEQVRIVREDIAFVVSQRLLKKDEKQKALIREHLSRFTSLYTRLSEDLEMYVNLFPIHPAYLTTFEKVNVAEKRVALKTISNEIKRILEDDVPEGAPGLISYDSYWKYIEEDPSYKSNPDIREVLDKSRILKDRIQNAFTKKIYQPMAIRIVNALAVYRLATSDIFDKVGLTPEELRDDLFLHSTMSLEMLLEDDNPSDFLKTTVEAALREIQKTVSFQYISTNESNGQYYLDLKKDIAVDDLIEQKAETIEDDKLDSYYFEVLKQATGVADNTYVTGYKIWKHNLPWEAHKVTRQGYLFFGAPNERSTAQPERDFYIYMLKPFSEVKFKDEQKADEVFFKLTIKEEKFIRLLKMYAGSRELGINATSATKQLYVRKSETYFKELVKWLSDNFVHVYEITYRGKTANILEFGMLLPQNAGVIEIINSVSEGLLTDWFEQKYPDYPSFRKLQNVYLNKENLPSYVSDSLIQISGRETRQGTAILDGLVLIDQNGKLNVHKSGYAKWVMNKLNEKGHGQVLNASELIETITIKGTEDIRLTYEFKLEPELFAVVLAALVHAGELVVNVDGKSYDAMNYAEFSRLPLGQLIYFNYVKKPSGLPVAAINALFQISDVRIPNLEGENLAFGIRRVMEFANNKLQRVVRMIPTIRTGLPIWDGTLFSTAEVGQYVQKMDDLKEFLEGIGRYDSPAKMHNLRYSAEEILAQDIYVKELEKLEKLETKVREFTNVANYLTQAKLHLDRNHEWSKKVDAALYDLSIALKEGEDYSSESRTIEQLKDEYIRLYMELHDKSRLNATQDMKKSGLLNDQRLKALRELAQKIDILPNQVLSEWQRRLDSFITCYQLKREDLQHSATCPHCKFRPKEEASLNQFKLETLEDELGELLNNWTNTLLNNFNDPTIKENIALLRPEQQELVQQFISQKSFSLPIDIRLIQAINDLLKGINKVEITLNQITDMMANGSPLTVEELRRRFEMLIQQTVGNQPTNQIRVMLKK